MERILSPERLTSVKGFGMLSAEDGYVFRPSRKEEIPAVFELARTTGRRVVLRGSGRSYGDASIRSEAIVLDICRMNRVIDWDPESGLIDCQAGVTIEGLWRCTLEDGFWPPVVSGTMFPTLAGALGMNIHGKNALRVGPIGSHVQEIEVFLPRGEFVVLTPNDAAFYDVISSAGLLGVIVRVKLKMKPIHSGDLKVLPISCPDWDAQFRTFEEYEQNADYLVSWIDCFGRGKGRGRGLIHAAWYTEEADDKPASLRLDNQDLPDTILGFFPKSVVWRFLKLLNHRPGMRFVNGAKYASSRLLGDGKPHPQSLVAFSFLLDYVPGWRNAYLPGGFIQYQSFVPKENAKQVYDEQIALQQASKLESFLGVLKRHHPDPFLFSHATEGYSLALDFKVTDGNRERVWKLCHRMNDLVLQAGGRFYFAKDSTLRPSDVQAYLGEEMLMRYWERKQSFDPENLLTSRLAERLQLVLPA